MPCDVHLFTHLFREKITYIRTKGYAGRLLGIVFIWQAFVSRFDKCKTECLEKMSLKYKLGFCFHIGRLSLNDRRCMAYKVHRPRICVFLLKLKTWGEYNYFKEPWWICWSNEPQNCKCWIWAFWGDVSSGEVADTNIHAKNRTQGLLTDKFITVQSAMLVTGPYGLWCWLRGLVPRQCDTAK